MQLRPDTVAWLRSLGDGRVIVGPSDAEGVTGGALAVFEPSGASRGLSVEAAVAGRLGVPTTSVHVRDVLALDHDRCLVLVNGSTPERFLIGLWLVRLSDRSVTPLADADALAAVSGLGGGTYLADGRLVAGDGRVWVCLSCFGQTTILKATLDLAGSPKVTLQAGVDTLNDDQGRPLTIEADDLLTADTSAAGATGAAGSARVASPVAAPAGVAQGVGVGVAGSDRALLVRPAAGRAWSIDLATGTVVGRPPGLLPLEGVKVPGPSAKRASLAFVTDDGRSVGDADVRVQGTVRYPAFVLSRPGERPTVIDRDAIEVRPGFPTHALRITAWCVEPASGNVIAYDAMSGEVLRLEIEEGRGDRR